MAEVVGFVSAITSLIGVANKIVQYIHTVKDAQKEKDELAAEAASSVFLLIRLDQRIKDSQTSQDWKSTVDATVSNQIVQVENALSELSKELELDAKGLQKFRNKMLWFTNKDRLKEIIWRIHRLNHHVGLALQDKLMQVTVTSRPITSGC